MHRLATTCPACSTMFKVVADQLKISEGWVRCGQCGHVFNAPLYFETLERGVDPAEKPANVAVTDPPAPAPAPVLSPIAVTADARSKVDTADRADKNEVSDSQFLNFDPKAWRQARESLHLEAVATSAVKQKQPEPVPSHPFLDTVDLSLAPDKQAEAEDRPDGPIEHNEPDVSFVQEARRKAFWQKTSVRLILVSGCSVLLALLALQAAVHYRNPLAAMEPRLQPMLQAICVHAQCQIEPHRDIASLIVESASLTKTDVAGLNFRLSFALKNKSSLALEAPMVELTLTDAQDKAYLRRVLTPAQYGAPAPLLQAQADFAGVVDFAMADTGGGINGNSAGKAALPPVGYLVVAFYP